MFISNENNDVQYFEGSFYSNISLNHDICIIRGAFFANFLTGPISIVNPIKYLGLSSSTFQKIPNSHCGWGFTKDFDAVSVYCEDVDGFFGIYSNENSLCNTSLCHISIFNCIGTRAITYSNGNHMINNLNVSFYQGKSDSAFYIDTSTCTRVSNCIFTSNHARNHAITTFQNSKNFFSDSIFLNNSQVSQSYGLISCFQYSTFVQCYRITVIEKDKFSNAPFMSASGTMIAIQCYLSDKSRIGSNVQAKDFLGSPIEELPLNPMLIHIVQRKSCRRKLKFSSIFFFCFSFIYYSK